MAKGISIHIGLNHVDPNAYGGWSGQLAGCINDARAMQQIAAASGYQTTCILDEQATADQVISAIGQSSSCLASDDILLVTYSGHGGQVPDVNGDEDDGKDETWVLYDRMLIDDELYQLWAQVGSGVRVFVLSDSCHSGTVARMMMYSELSKSSPISRQYRGVADTPPRFRAIPSDKAYAAYQANKKMYDARQWAARRGNDEGVNASLILISGCMDNQLSADGDSNGLFTQNLLEVWNSGSFDGNYPQFCKEIVDKMPPTQTPNYFKVGADNSNFEDQIPFTIGDGRGGRMPAAAPGKPVVRGPDRLARDAASAPKFDITSPNPYWVFEASNDPALFRQYPASNSDGFFATWQDPRSPARLSGASYTLPPYAWEGLKKGARLYYRIGTTTSPNGDGWENYVVSTPDGQAESAPSIEITGARDATRDMPEDVGSRGASDVWGGSGWSREAGGVMSSRGVAAPVCAEGDPNGPDA